MLLQVCHLFTFIARQLARHEDSLAVSHQSGIFLGVFLTELLVHYRPQVDRRLFEEVLDRLTAPGDTSRVEEREQVSSLTDEEDAGWKEKFFFFLCSLAP